MAENMLKEGLTYTCEKRVTAADLAAAVGSGELEVLATPSMAALMERAAMLSVAGALPEGSSTVGTRLEINHLRATVPGATVSATAVLTAVDGRRLTFRVEAADQRGTIGGGLHERVVVDREKFLAKLF